MVTRWQDRHYCYTFTSIAPRIVTCPVPVCDTCSNQGGWAQTYARGAARNGLLFRHSVMVIMLLRRLLHVYHHNNTCRDQHLDIVLIPPLFQHRMAECTTTKLNAESHLLLVCLICGFHSFRISLMSIRIIHYFVFRTSCFVRTSKRRNGRWSENESMP